MRWFEHRYHAQHIGRDLGASTSEAEDNCAIMVADELRDYLEHGNIQNAVNFPDVAMPRESPFRVGIANAKRSELDSERARG